MEKDLHEEIDDISLEELELMRTLAQLECVDEGIYPELNFSIDKDIEDSFKN